MKTRVGKIPYLNSEPFYYRMVRDDIELISLVPSDLSRAAEAGEIDAGPVPIVDCFRLEDRFTQLGQFCIATLDKARSILLYSKRPIHDLGGATIGITGETSTSRRLLQVLLAYRFEVEPKEYVTLNDEHDAFLLIGDEALRRRYGVPGYPYRYDLGEEWHKWTKMPFVFALWVVDKNMPEKRMTYLENVLYTCVDEGLEHMSLIGQMREDVRMSTREIVEYYQGFRYWAGVGEIKAMAKFREYLTSLGLISAP